MSSWVVRGRTRPWREESFCGVLPREPWPRPPGDNNLQRRRLHRQARRRWQDSRVTNPGSCAVKCSYRKFGRTGETISAIGLELSGNTEFLSPACRRAPRDADLKTTTPSFRRLSVGRARPAAHLVGFRLCLERNLVRDVVLVRDVAHVGRGLRPNPLGDDRL